RASERLRLLPRLTAALALPGAEPAEAGDRRAGGNRAREVQRALGGAAPDVPDAGADRRVVARQELLEPARGDGGRDEQRAGRRRDGQLGRRVDLVLLRAVLRRHLYRPL